MNYEVKTQQFSGPLDKLLQLIEEKHLEITQINLAEVTADFLNYAKSLEADVSPQLLADFLVVAAKLVLIKSKVLLPILELSQEEEEEIHDLEGRLRIYREFCAKGAISPEANAPREHASGGKPAIYYIQELWNKNKVAYGRPLFYSCAPIRVAEGQRPEAGYSHTVFYPPPGLRADDLVRSVKNLAAVLQAFLPETKTIKKAVITIEEKIEELLNRVKEATKHTFRSLAQQKSRGEAIILFLAVLHLLKNRIIAAEQREQFGEITIEKQL